MRSGSTVFRTVDVIVEVEDEAGKGTWGWNDGGACSKSISHGNCRTSSAQLAGSRPLPPRTLSVVAATLPPFRCRSHMISLLFNCGNICVICSTCTGVKRCPFRRAVISLLEDLEDIKYLIMKNERNATNASEGIERVDSSSAEAIAKSVLF